LQKHRQTSLTVILHQHDYSLTLAQHEINKSVPSVPSVTVSAVAQMTASSSPAAPTGSRLVDDKSDRFVDVNLSGFESTSATFEKKVEARETVVKEMDVVVVNKAAPKPHNSNEQYQPLGPGELLWDPKMDPVRSNNILGGWGKSDNRHKPLQWKRNK
jgi:hypothetical protein